jgi:hypothetical protein
MRVVQRQASAPALLACLVLVLAGTSVASPDTTPRASWTCIRDVCVGTTVAAMNDRYGPGWATPYDGAVSAGIAVPGGRVYVTNMGELCRATRRITTISTSDPIVRLPDGVEIGSKVPAVRTWRGYAYSRSAWRKRIVVKGSRREISLKVRKGRVVRVALILGWNIRCGA